MRHITKLLPGCLLAIFYIFLFVSIFIITITLGMLCTPFIVTLIIVWITSMIYSSTIDVWNYAKNLGKS